MSHVTLFPDISIGLLSRCEQLGDQLLVVVLCRGCEASNVEVVLMLDRLLSDRARLQDAENGGAQVEKLERTVHRGRPEPLPPREAWWRGWEERGRGAGVGRERQ